MKSQGDGNHSGCLECTYLIQLTLLSFSETSLNRTQSITLHLFEGWCHLKKRFTPVLLGSSGTAGCRAEGSAAAPRWLLTSFALCGGPFPVNAGNGPLLLILETDFLWQLIRAKALLKPLSAVRACTVKRRKGGGSFETHLPHLTGCGVFPSLFFLLLWPHIFSLSLSFTLHTKLLPFPPCAELMFHCWVLFGFSNVNTQESAWVEELPQPKRYSESPRRALVRWNSQGPNVNTARDTPSQRAFKPSNRGS